MLADEIARRYEGWQRGTHQARGFRGTITLDEPGEGTTVSWLGFNTPSLGGPPKAWFQIGLLNDRRPYIEYQLPGQERVIEFGETTTSPKLAVELIRQKNGWRASLNGTVWKNIPVGVLSQMYAGVERWDNSTARMGIGDLNIFVKGKWVPFRGAKRIKR